MIRSQLKKAIKLTALCGLALSAISLSAHTISIGTYNAGAPGSVTVAMGTYSSGHGSLFAQGSIALIGGPSAVQSPIPVSGPIGPIAFGNHTLVKPVQLIDGTNNFFASGTSTVGEYNSAVNNTSLPETNWQTATFTGLAAGWYTYQITGMTAVNWADLNSNLSNWTGTLFIPGSSVVSTPDSGSALAMLGAALLGFVTIRRRFSRS